MQNPEVWCFKEPQSSFTIQEFKSNFPENQIDRFSFNHLISVVLPDCLRVPDSLQNILSDDCDYYKIINLNLAELLNPNFVNNFIKKGKLILLSIGTRIDCDNSCAVTPYGRLVLSVTKDTYQRFGLDGRVSHFTKKNKDRYSSSTGITHLNLVNILRVNPMKYLEELRVLYSCDMNMRTVELLLASCPNLKVLSELESWQGISMEELKTFKQHIREVNFDLDISPTLSFTSC